MRASSTSVAAAAKATVGAHPAGEVIRVDEGPVADDAERAAAGIDLPDEGEAIVREAQRVEPRALGGHEQVIAVAPHVARGVRCGERVELDERRPLQPK